MDIILQGGSVVLPNNKIEELDIGICDSKINAIGDLSRSSSQKIINIKNLLVIPGVIDTQVHFREPGLTHKEDIFHGTMGAVLGGVTSIFEMPNTKPPTTNLKELTNKFKIAEKSGFCNFSFFIGATRENIEEINELESFSGCCGVKIFMGSSTGDLLVEDDESIIKILKRAKKTVAVHSEDEYRLKQRKKDFLNKKILVSDHPVIRDVESAVISTVRLLKAARISKKKIHILHLSTANEVDLLKSNKDIATCEATPQHLFFHSQECYERLGSLAQMNPPIRDKSHSKVIWQGVQTGVIDVIGSDHAPHTLEEKSKEYPNSPSGMPGVQTLLPIMLNHVNEGRLTLNQLINYVCENPIKIFGIKNKGFIKEGYDADFTIVDMNKIIEIKNENIESKCKWSPFNGDKFKGTPVATIIRGKVKMKDGEIIGDPSGKPLEFN